MAQRVGPYVLGKTLGVGSTGRVKLGTHVDTNHNVAIKIVTKEFLASKASLQKKIEREITLMKLIRHPNVLSLYDVYESDKELFLVLEYVEGGELFDYLVKRGRLPEREALIFFQQIINGLDFCHQHLVCHRDLKPENLLLDSSLNVKIADFGMATLQPEGKYLETSCGSPHYASPEIIKGEKYDGATADIWSCGVILYALLTGNLPFDDENIRKLLGKVKSGLYFMPNSLSEGSRDLIKRMLVVDPAHRITMQQIKTHPWFMSNANNKTNSELLPAVPVTIPKSPDDLDMEVVENLQLLGYDNINELITNILGQQKTMEQIFYLLLWERKKEFFENGDGEDTTWDDPQGARRRSSSANSHREVLDRKSPRGSLASPPAENGAGSVSAPTADKYVASPLSNSSSASSMPSTATTMLSSPPLSPISEGDPAAPNGRNSPDSHRRSSAGSPSSMRARTSSDGGRALLTAAVSPKMGKKKPGSIDIPATDSSATAMGSPRFHRHRVSESSDSSPAAGNSSTPKKSWFASLFNFKGAIVTSRSKLPVTETAEAVQTALRNADVVVTKANKDFVYKCRIDAGGKSARLRVDIVAGEDFKFDVVFVQEKGNAQVFHTIVNEVCAQANLEITGSTTA